MTITQAEQILKLLTEIKDAQNALTETLETQAQEISQIRERLFDIELDYGDGFSIDN
jgi:hypothetical protein